jgi:protein-tyrosine phosphatase
MICTANICRSPIAEALLARALADRQIDARVRSAGRLSGGRPPTRAGLQITRRMGLNLDAHRSQQVTDRMIRDSDLVVGMAREHVLYAVGLAPEALPRSFTLKDLVRRAEAVGPRKPDEMLGDWLARLEATRGPTDLLGSSPDDDVADPIGQSATRYQEIANEIDALVTQLVSLAWPPTGGG